ncbi:PucR family transcriptional regulator ligand-binding domain-containing protein [Nocardioides sp. LMS-CY]|uniref:Purine catabolism regulator n=1 Tax=Nocardioides soli TaxID=1036020 RepID=A0A7W4Z1E1_9ACTN|nr:MULTISPECIES: PucR family transcriptional regulator [Nocardioides]MBB3042768.1 purine catabolism regulator [Nocardioides soli]QWF22879.1 PucR family transcriptional regulator ligand-binding domain-containing protein [Nocardioides sp. LMS-CY]
MMPTLRDVLAMPSFRSASVEVVTGDLDAVVRWVHSSEVYEMGGLLAGGEVLLTSGLGLHGRTAEQLVAYVDQLADAGCVALAMEIGRSFFDVPPELIDTARRRDVAFLALHSVVPFERMVEDFHDLLVRRKLGSTRSSEAIWQELLSPVMFGQGMAVLLDAVARLAGCAAELVDTDGRVVERSRIAVPSSETDRVVTEVRVQAGVAGRVVLLGRGTARRTAVAHRAAAAVALELGRHPGVGQRPSLAQAIVTDLVTGALASAGDLRKRLTDIGWTPGESQHVLVAAVDVDHKVPVQELLPPVREAVHEVLGPCVSGVAGSQVVVLAHGWQRAEPQRLRAAFVEVYDAVLAGAGDLAVAVRTLAVAAPVVDLAEVGAAVAQAREVVQIARRFGTRTGVLLTRDVGVQRLLAAGPAAALAAFVSEQLGPLIDHDRETSGDLVRTLDAFVSHGASKARTATALGIRRQSLYARLARVERLLGISLDDAAQVSCLSVALVAWRMRTGLDLQAAFDRKPA